MKQSKLEDLLSPKKLLLPIIIAVVVMGYLFYSKFNVNVFQYIEFGWHSVFWLIILLLLVCIRHLAYMYRIRILSGKKLNWRQSFNVISLWEFSSAISPSAVGGSAVAMFILNKEGLNLGKSTTIAIATLFLDLLAFILLSSLCLILLGTESFFGIAQNCEEGSELATSFFTNLPKIYVFVVIGIVLMLAAIYYGVFVNSSKFRRLIIWVFSGKWLKKWRSNAVQMTYELELAAIELRTKQFLFWAQVFLATLVTWSARFLLVNPVLAAFTKLSVIDHLVVYARNFVLWLVMLVPTTPGASGVSEATLGELICEFVPYPGLSPVILLIWRFFDYFIYLILGVIILPRWINKTFTKKAESN